MSKVKRNIHTSDNPLTVDGVTPSEVAPPKNTLSDFTRKSLIVMERYIEKDYINTKRLEMKDRGEAFLKKSLNEKNRVINEKDNEIEKLKIRNEYLEKNNGNVQIKKMHEMLKNSQMVDIKNKRKKELDEQLRREEEEYFRSIGAQGFEKYANDPNISAKKNKKY